MNARQFNTSAPITHSLCFPSYCLMLVHTFAPSPPFFPLTQLPGFSPYSALETLVARSSEGWPQVREGVSE